MVFCGPVVRSLSVSSTKSGCSLSRRNSCSRSTSTSGNRSTPSRSTLIDGRLIDELLGRGCPLPPVDRQQLRERPAVSGVDEVGARTRQHVGVEPVGQAYLLPDAHRLLIGGDGAGAKVDVVDRVPRPPPSARSAPASWPPSHQPGRNRRSPRRTAGSAPSGLVPVSSVVIPTVIERSPCRSKGQNGGEAR